jgi:hypothetical protein
MMGLCGGAGGVARAEDDRRAPRQWVSVKARLRPDGYKRRSVLIYSISLTGFCVRSIDHLPAHTPCWLTIPEVGRFAVRSIWWEPGRGGGFAFQELLERGILEQIVACSN